MPRYACPQAAGHRTTVSPTHTPTLAPYRSHAPARAPTYASRSLTHQRTRDNAHCAMMRGAPPHSPSAPDVAAALATTSDPVATAAHSDDSYCALCRRCQMRKKLEKRLAMRRSPDCEHDDERTTLPPPPRDERSITELLDYIGERAPTPARPAGRRARRKRAAAMRRRALADADPAGSRKGRVSRERDRTLTASSTPPSRRADSELAHDARALRALQERAIQHSFRDRVLLDLHDHDLLDDENESHDHASDTPVCSDESCAAARVAFHDDELPTASDGDTDFVDPVDQEVEEFRRLLEAAHINAGDHHSLQQGATLGSR